MNRSENRKANSKLNKLSQKELDIIILNYIRNLFGMSFWMRLKFAFRIVFKIAK